MRRAAGRDMGGGEVREGAAARIDDDATAAAATAAAARVDDGAVVRGDVRLGRGAWIGRGCVIEGDVRIGDGTRIDDYCIVRGRVRIGEDNWVYPFCVIGTGPQHAARLEDRLADPASDPAHGEVVIGTGNIIREYTTVHLPALDERTSIGSRCHLLANSHVAHDCAVGDDVTMANGVTLGGHSQVGRRANLGFNVSVHPYRRIGAHAMVAMMMPVVKDVPPYALVNRQAFVGVNEVGMKRAGMGAGEIGAVREAYGRLGRQDGDGGSRLEAEIREFVASSKRGCYLPERPAAGPGAGSGGGAAQTAPQ